MLITAKQGRVVTYHGATCHPQIFTGSLDHVILYDHMISPLPRSLNTADWWLTFEGLLPIQSNNPLIHCIFTCRRPMDTRISKLLTHHPHEVTWNLEKSLSHFPKKLIAIKLERILILGRRFGTQILTASQFFIFFSAAFLERLVNVVCVIFIFCCFRCTWPILKLLHDMYCASMLCALEINNNGAFNRARRIVLFNQ